MASASALMERPISDHGMEDFASMLDETLGRENGFEGSVVTGRVIRLTDEFAIVDVGLKSEGRVALEGIRRSPARPIEVKPGDNIDLYVERYEDRDGSIVLSREKARREEAWTNLEKAFEAQQRVNGTIYGRVKGGFTVDLGGAVAFLPGSQVDIRPVRDVGPLMGTPQPFQILKMDRARGNIVVSRRAVLEETRAEQRSELIQGLKEGMILDGVVKNITDYGAFVDLGGVDGLLHVTDIAWRRINHPSEALQIGQAVRVQVIRFNSETQRISLGMKQLEADPWEGVAAKYPPGAKYSGRVTNITDYGAFVELEPGVEGLVHVSEMSWTKKNVHPGKIVATSRRKSTSSSSTSTAASAASRSASSRSSATPGNSSRTSTPWAATVEGEVRNITEFGLFIGISADIDGMVHMSDLSWDEAGRAGHHQVREGPDGPGQGPRRRPREGAHQPRHQAAPGRPGRRRAQPRQEERRRHLRRDRGPGERHRGQGRRHPHRLHPPGRTGARQVANSVRTASPSARRWTPRSPPSTAPPASSASRSRAARSRKTSRPSRTSAPQTAAPPWATSWVRRSVAGTRPRVGLSLESDLLLDRRRLKRRLNLWRVLAVVAVAAALPSWP